MTLCCSQQTSFTTRTIIICNDHERCHRDQSGRAHRCAIIFRLIILVLQGGGALGAYQAGVYQALHEAGIEPDWIIDTSMAINASLIAGNTPANRVNKLEEFWRRIERRDVPIWGAPWRGLLDSMSNWTTVLGGIPGFFEPYPPAFWGTHIR